MSSGPWVFFFFSSKALLPCPASPIFALPRPLSAHPLSLPSSSGAAFGLSSVNTWPPPYLITPFLSHLPIHLFVDILHPRQTPSDSDPPIPTTFILLSFTLEPFTFPRVPQLPTSPCVPVCFTDMRLSTRVTPHASPTVLPPICECFPVRCQLSNPPQLKRPVFVCAVQSPGASAASALTDYPTREQHPIGMSGIVHNKD